MNVKEKLELIYRDVFDDESIEIFDEMTADDIDDWDSLSHMELIVEIESEFDIKFTTAEIKNTKNVGEFIAIIEKRIV